MIPEYINNREGEIASLAIADATKALDNYATGYLSHPINNFPLFKYKKTELQDQPTIISSRSEEIFRHIFEHCLNKAVKNGKISFEEMDLYFKYFCECYKAGGWKNN